MKIVAVGGGKGGTGKTAIAVSIAKMFAIKRKILLVDLDVDNPCTYTLLSSKPEIIKEIYAFKPKILEDKCKLCGKCVEYCPVHALVLIPSKKILFIKTLCESCGNCMIVCPEGAIKEDKAVIGWIKEDKMDNLHLIVGEAKPGERKTDEVMTETIEYVEKIAENYELLIFDVPPGTGRGIYDAFKLADLVVTVTEPTMLGFHDLKKLYSLIRSMNKKSIAIINKYGLKGGVQDEQEEFLRNNRVQYEKIPYDEYMVKAYVSGETVIEAYPDSPSARSIKKIVKNLEKIMFHSA